MGRLLVVWDLSGWNMSISPAILDKLDFLRKSWHRWTMVGETSETLRFTVRVLTKQNGKNCGLPSTLDWETLFFMKKRRNSPRKMRTSCDLSQLKQRKYVGFPLQHGHRKIPPEFGVPHVPHARMPKLSLDAPWWAGANANGDGFMAVYGGVFYPRHERYERGTKDWKM